jgi:hypothetical protein
MVALLAEGSLTIMSENTIVTVCVWWMEHLKLKAEGVRSAVLCESFYSANGELIGGAMSSACVTRIGFPAGSIGCPGSGDLFTCQK